MTEATPYFSQDATGSPDKAGRWVDVDALRTVSFTEGLTFRPILADRSMVNFVYFEKHTEAPNHVHEEEQVTVVLEGEFEFELDGERKTLHAGQAAVIPPWVPHGARTHDTTCVEIDVFTPPRAVLLAKLLEQEEGREVQGGSN